MNTRKLYENIIFNVIKKPSKDEVDLRVNLHTTKHEYF